MRCCTQDVISPVKHTLTDVLDALHEHIEETGRPVATTAEIADRLPISRRAVLDELKLLERNGDIASHQAGRAKIGWPLDDGKE